MNENAIGVVMSALTEFDFWSQNVSLFGIDFFISDEFEVFILEASNQPNNLLTIKNNERMFKQIQEDIVKVCVDWKDKSTAKTGSFELLYHIGGLNSNTNTSCYVEAKGEKLYPPLPIKNPTPRLSSVVSSKEKKKPQQLPFVPSCAYRVNPRYSTPSTVRISRSKPKVSRPLGFIDSAGRKKINVK